MSLDQLLKVTFRGGKTITKRSPDWSDFSDMRERYANRPDVIDTEVVYDIPKRRR